MKLLDYLQREHGLSEKEAQGLIYAGKVYVNDQKVDKPGFLIKKSYAIRFTQSSTYPSRASIKLKTFIQSQSIDLSGKSVIDLGAAHGGFTKVALEFKAVQVLCVDGSYGQLALNLRSLPNVYALERTSVCSLSLDKLPFQPDFFVADLSFISARKSLECIRSIVKKPAIGIYLFKPQFEARAEQLEKGIVKNEDQRISLVSDFKDWLKKSDWDVISFENSFLRGRKGNQETLFFLQSKF